MSFFAVELEICVETHCAVSLREIETRVRTLLLQFDSVRLVLLHFAAHDAVLRANVRFARLVLAATGTQLRIDDFEHLTTQAPVDLAQISIFVFQLRANAPTGGGEASSEDSGEESSSASYVVHSLPHEQFDPLWDSLSFSAPIKQQLLAFVLTSMLFARRGVASHVVSSNRLLLLHGPPGTGKTSLCNALAHKLALRGYYDETLLIEINAHSLFSKWFSESGKLVAQLFARIRELTADHRRLVCVLVDEVESLAAARSAALNGVEPSDSIRVVNALLTQLDRLKANPNVLVMATSNITDAIDVAFVDRADLKLFVGPPDLAARYSILESCIEELLRADILVPRIDCLPFELVSQLAAAQQPTATGEDSGASDAVAVSLRLLAAAVQAEGASGRMLRKLPLLAVSRLIVAGGQQEQFDARHFLAVLVEAIEESKKIN